MCTARTPSLNAANDSSSFGIIPFVTTPSAIAFFPSAMVSRGMRERGIGDVAHHAGHVGDEDERPGVELDRERLATMSALML